MDELSKYQLLPPLTGEEYDALKTAIGQDGRAHVPIVIDENNEVLDGYHRLKACKELRIKEYITHVVRGLTEEEKIEHGLKLNLNRRHLSRIQLKSLAVELRGRGWTQEKIGQTLAVPQQTVSDWLGEFTDFGKLSEGVTGKDGKSYPTNRKPKTIVALRPRERGEAIELAKRIPDDALPDHPINTWKAAVIDRKSKNGSRALRELKPLPPGKFRIIYADPPWRHEFSVSDSRAVESHYPTLSLEEICNYTDRNGRHVTELVADDAVLFLWTTYPKNQEAFEVVRAWGFEYRSQIVWVKHSIGMGYYVREKHELLRIARRGNLPVPEPSTRPDSVIFSPRKGYSEKPELVYEIIERMYPIGNNGAKGHLELFATKRREGWVSHGLNLTQSIVVGQKRSFHERAAKKSL